MRRASCALFSLAATLTPAWAEAQAPDALVSALASLTDEAPMGGGAEPETLVVHVHAELEALAAPLARSLSRRVDGEVELGAPPPGGVCAATERGHACVAPLEAHDASSALVLFVGRDGRFYETEVPLPRERAPAVRALSIALVDVREAARDAVVLPSPEAGVSASARASGSSWVFVEREGGLFGRQRTLEPIARPILYLRAVVGFTTARSGFLFGPGIGLGICVTDVCAVIEGDVPVIEERRLLDADTPLSFRPIFLAVRLGYRPLRIGPVTTGITWGILDRIGNAWLGDTGESQLVNDLGLRASVEVAVEIERPFELVFEGGLDVTVSPARFLGRGAQSALLSDDVTGWGVTALRVRP